MKVLKKVGKIFLYIIAGLIILLFVIGLFIDPIAKNLLEKQVSNAAEGQYSLSLQEVDISILGGDVELTGLRFETDTVHHETPPIAFIKANKVEVEGVSWLKYLLTNKLVTDKILLDNFDIALYARTVEGEAEADTSQGGPLRFEQLDIYPAIKDQVERVLLKDLALNQISFLLVNVGTQDTLQFDADKLNFQSDNILLDADKLITENRALYASEIDFNVQGIDIRRSGQNNIEAVALAFNFVTNENIMGIQVKDLSFLQKNSGQNDTLTFVAFQEFELREFNLNRLEEDSVANLEEISLSDLNFISKGEPEEAGSAGEQDSTAADAAPFSLAEFSAGEMLPDLIKRLKLNELDINQADIRLGDSVRIQGAGLQANQLIISGEAAFADNRFLHAATMDIHVDLIAATPGPDQLKIIISDFALKMDEGTGRTGFTKLLVSTEVKSDKEMWFEAELGPFEIVNLDTRNLSAQELSIDSIGILNPVLLVNLPEETQQSQENQNQAKPEQDSPFNLYPAIEGILDRISIRKLAVTGADIQVFGMGKSEDPLKIPALYLQVRDMLIAEGTAFENNRVLHAEDIAFRTERIVFPVDEVYTLEARLVRFSTFEQFFELRGMKYGYGQNAEAKFKKHGTNQLMNISNRLFRIKNLNFQRLFEKQEFFASSAQAEGFELFAYNNENYSPGGTEAEKEAVKEAEKVAATMPQTQIKQIDFPFYLKSFDLNSGTIRYKQMAPEADTAGVMEISDFFVNIRNLTNVKNILMQNPEIETKTGGKIMGSGAFELLVDLNMVSESNEVDIRGKLDTLNVTELNNFTEYISRLGFKSGEIYEVNWIIDANEEKAEGTLEMSYNNLDIRISESNNPDDSGILKEAGTFLANNLVLESDVAEKSSEEPEQTEISEERGENEPFPAYILKSLVWGFVDIMVTIF